MIKLIADENFPCIYTFSNNYFFYQNISAQSTNTKINVGESLIIHSNILNEDRTILVYLPEGYSESKESYPVLYLTDGETHLVHTGGDVSLLSSPGIDYMPKLIIVGITNTNRQETLHLLHYMVLTVNFFRIPAFI